MSRYSGPLGKQFSGDRDAAMSLQGRAGILVAQVWNDINAPPFNGKGSIHRDWHMPDGTVIHAYVQTLGAAPIARTWIESPLQDTGNHLDRQITYIWLAAVWKPEGLVLTPSNDSARFGWGFPKRDGITGELINPPYGTPIRDDRAGVLVKGNKYASCNQVIINKFANNKYLDHPDFISGLPDGFTLPDNPRLRTSLEEPLPQGGLGFYVTWPAGYEPIDVTRIKESLSVWGEAREHAFDDRPGYRRGLLPYYPTAIYQFDENGNDLLYEEETESWYAHWPEELLYDTAAAETIFQLTNEQRLAVGVEPLSRHIRGFHDPGVLLASEVYLSKVMAHEDDATFRPGRADPNDRFGSYMRLLGENLAMGNGEFHSKSLGKNLIEQWVDSPGHYSNIVNARWSNPLGHLAVTTRPAVTINRWHLTNDDAPGEEIAFTGTFGVATHYDTKNNGRSSYIGAVDAGTAGFVAAGLLHNNHEQGLVGWSRPFPGTFVSYPVLEETKLGQDCIYFRNRKYRVAIPERQSHDIEVRSVMVGATAFEDGGLLWLRAVICVVIRTISYSFGFPVPEDIQTAEIRCLKWPVRATENMDTDDEEMEDAENTPWLVESVLPVAVFSDVLSTDTLRPSIAGAFVFTSSPCVFLPDGSEGRFTYPILRLTNAGEFTYPKYPGPIGDSGIEEAPNATPLFWTLVEIEVVDGQLALRREILGPELTMDIEYECDPDVYYGATSVHRPMKAIQSCIGEVDVFPLVREGEFVYARYEFDMRVEQRYPSNWNEIDEPFPPEEAIDAHRREWLHLPSGQSLQVVAYEIVKGYQNTPIYLRTVDHIGLNSDDFMYREYEYNQYGSSEATRRTRYYHKDAQVSQSSLSWPATNMSGGNTLTTRATRPFDGRGYLLGGFHLVAGCPEDPDDPDNPEPKFEDSVEYQAGDPQFTSPHRQFLVFSALHMAHSRNSIILELQGFAGAVNASNAPDVYFLPVRFAKNMRAGLCFNITQNDRSLTLGVTGYSPPSSPTTYYGAPFMVSALKFDFSGSQFARYKDVFVGAFAIDASNARVVSEGIDDLDALLGVSCTDVRPLGVL